MTKLINYFQLDTICNDMNNFKLYLTQNTKINYNSNTKPNINQPKLASNIFKLITTYNSSTF